MSTFSPNTNPADARKLRSAALAVAGALLLASSGLFSESVLQRKLLVSEDIVYKEQLHVHAMANDDLRNVMSGLTHLADSHYLVYQACIVLIVLLYLRQLRLALVWSAVRFGGFKLDDLLKDD